MRKFKVEASHRWDGPRFTFFVEAANAAFAKAEAYRRGFEYAHSARLA